MANKNDLPLGNVSKNQAENAAAQKGHKVYYPETIRLTSAWKVHTVAFL